MEISDLNELEKIGLAFLSGLVAATCIEKDIEDAEEEKTEKIEAEKIEIKKVTQEEMGKNLDDLKNKILGGK